MPIYEKSFRIGCGRYIQAPDAILSCGEEVLRLGHYPLILGDDTTLALTRDLLAQSFAGKCEKYEMLIWNGPCCDEAAKDFAAKALSLGCDVIVGVGGGVLMDLAKLCAHFAALPVINIPTSSATCAAYAPLSVRYTPEGRTVGSMHYEREVDAVIADTALLAKQPIRLLLSGVFDALAKFLEIKQRYREGQEVPLGLDYAYAMAAHSYEVLMARTPACIEAMKRGEITYDVEQVIFTAIAATGTISGIARGSNQCALAHKFYENSRYLYFEQSKPYLHGEIVGVGLLLQNHFNGELAENDRLLALMRAYDMPYSVPSLGVPCDEESLEKYYERICNSSAIDKSNAAECEKFKESLRYLWKL